ncbi:MAG: hypothetical protein Q4C13_05300 [Clostridia bacterium]|nr:hypothetical protein [Clostridia bacterium]
MGSPVWICYLLPLIALFLLYCQRRREQRQMNLRLTLKRKGRGTIVSGIIDQFIGKECLVYTMSAQITGTIRSVQDGWLVIDNGRELDSVNLDYVMRIREYPRNKSGKKKSVVLD